jgi:hypothetical protein
MIFRELRESILTVSEENAAALVRISRGKRSLQAVIRTDGTGGYPVLISAFFGDPEPALTVCNFNFVIPRVSNFLALSS